MLLASALVHFCLCLAGKREKKISSGHPTVTETERGGGGDATFALENEREKFLRILL